jgi:hypothetical protein
MTKRTKSASVSKRSKPKGSAVGRRVVKGLELVLAHRRGEVELPGYTVTVTKHKTKRGQREGQPRAHA